MEKLDGSLTPTTVPTALDFSIAIVSGEGRRETGKIVCPALKIVEVMSIQQL